MLRVNADVLSPAPLPHGREHVGPALAITGAPGRSTRLSAPRSHVLAQRRHRRHERDACHWQPAFTLTSAAARPGRSTRASPRCRREVFRGQGEALEASGFGTVLLGTPRRIIDGAGGRASAVRHGRSIPRRERSKQAMDSWSHAIPGAAWSPAFIAIVLHRMTSTTTRASFATRSVFAPSTPEGVG